MEDTSVEGAGLVICVSQNNEHVAIEFELPAGGWISVERQKHIHVSDEIDVISVQTGGLPNISDFNMTETLGMWVDKKTETLLGSK